MTENVKTNFISQTWLVLLLAICFGALLAGMQITLGPTIEANKINETLEKVNASIIEKLEAKRWFPRSISAPETPAEPIDYEKALRVRSDRPKL